MVIECGHCGKSCNCDDEMIFCPYCGNKISENEEDATETRAEQTYQGAWGAQVPWPVQQTAVPQGFVQSPAVQQMQWNSQVQWPARQGAMPLSCEQPAAVQQAQWNQQMPWPVQQTAVPQGFVQSPAVQQTQPIAQTPWPVQQNNQQPEQSFTAPYRPNPGDTPLMRFEPGYGYVPIDPYAEQREAERAAAEKAALEERRRLARERAREERERLKRELHGELEPVNEVNASPGINAITDLEREYELAGGSGGGAVSAGAALSEHSRIYMGSYPFKENGSPKSIEWEVLATAGDKKLLFATMCLDFVPFNNSEISCLWGDSSLRQWLCGEFMRDAFNSAEIEAMLPVNFGDDAVSEPDEDGNGDRIFLLSEADLEKYGVCRGQRPESRATPYAWEKGARSYNSKEAFWWIRTSGRDNGRSVKVAASNFISKEGLDVTIESGVRPAIWVDVSKLEQVVTDRSLTDFI